MHLLRQSYYGHSLLAPHGSIISVGSDDLLSFNAWEEGKINGILRARMKTFVVLEDSISPKHTEREQ